MGENHKDREGMSIELQKWCRERHRAREVVHGKVGRWRAGAGKGRIQQKGGAGKV